jgi:hypothetical protein
VCYWDQIRLWVAKDSTLNCDSKTNACEKFTAFRRKSLTLTMSRIIGKLDCKQRKAPTAPGWRDYPKGLPLYVPLHLDLSHNACAAHSGLNGVHTSI